MDRHDWARVAVLPVALLVATGLASCGSTPAATTNKRLPNQRVCDLVKSEDVERAVDKIATEYRSQDGSQCFFYFESPRSASVDRAIEKAKDGTLIEIDGVTANKLEKTGKCDIDVWLAPGDINQQFTVDAGSCDKSMALARIILNKLPG